MKKSMNLYKKILILLLSYLIPGTGVSFCADSLVLISSNTADTGFTDICWDMELDGGGDIILVGEMLYFEPLPFYPVPPRNFIMARFGNDLSTTNDRMWHDITDTDFGRSVCIKDNGEIVITGHCGSPISDIYSVLYGAFDGVDREILTLTTVTCSNPDFVDWSNSSAIDGSGNIYIAGKCDTDILVVKYDENLVEVSSVTYSFGASSSAYCNDVVIDAAGNVIVAGVIFPTAADDGNYTLFVRKYNNGLTQELGSIEFSDFDRTRKAGDCARRIEIDSDGDIFTAGYIGDMGERKNILVVKFDSNLTAVLGYYLSPDENDNSAYDICQDENGGMIVAGSREVNGNEGLYIVRFDSDLNVIEDGTYFEPGASALCAVGVAVDAQGDITIGGRISKVGYDFFVAKLKWPFIKSVMPDWGIQGETVNIDIKGKKYTQQSDISFSGAGITVNSVSYVNMTSLEAEITISPDVVPGLRDITVSSPDYIATDIFEVKSIAVSSVSPPSALLGNVLEVTINGSNFRDISSIVFSGGYISVTTFTVQSMNVITSEISISSSAAPGKKDVTITNTGGATGVGSGVFEVKSIIVSSVSPASALPGDVLDVTIQGSNFVSIKGVSFGNGVTVNTFAVKSVNEIQATISVQSGVVAGLRDVTVTNEFGYSDSLSGGFEVKPSPPEIISLDPSSVEEGDTLDVTVSGNHFRAGAEIKFSGEGITVNTAGVMDEHTITVNITLEEDLITGLRDITVVNTDDTTFTLFEAFRVEEKIVPLADGDPGSDGIDAGIGNIKMQGGANGYVNPSKGEQLKIHFRTLSAGMLEVDIFTVRGQGVKKLSKYTDGTEDDIVWDCRNDSGAVVASGIYICIVKGPGLQQTKKIAILK